MAEDEKKTFLDLGEVGRGEELVKREVLHELVVLVDCGDKQSACAFAWEARKRLTDVGRLLESSVCDERDRCVEPLRVLEDVERKNDRLAPKLLLDPLEGLLHAEPKVDLLTCHTARDVAVELGDVLNLLDPAVDFALELVEESRVGEEVGVDGFDRGSSAVALSECDGGRDGGVDREDDVGDLDILLDCVTTALAACANPKERKNARWRRESSSSANFFFVIGMPILLSPSFASSQIGRAHV